MKFKSDLFSIGFRPFFFLASIYASVAIGLWALVYGLSLQLPVFNYYPMLTWHAHEMIFAYSMAVIAGFLLTAIKNWTGVQTVNGWKLILLVSIWIIARIIPFVIDDSRLIALADLLFLPLLAVFIAIPLLKTNNRRNYFMIVMVLIFAFLNLLIHLELLDYINNVAQLAYKSAFYLIIALILVMAGRVFPMFSQNGVAKRYQVKKYVIIENLALPSYFIFALSVLFVPMKLIVLFACVFACVVHAIRLKGWYNVQIWHTPLVWVLHLGYLFLLVGFVMTALSLYYPVFQNLALHTFSIGTLGVITIGMMARVSIGHTGRNLRSASKVLKIIFLLLFVAVVIRVFMPIFDADSYQMYIVLSASLWSLAFLLFFLKYATIWIKPRVDL